MHTPSVLSLDPVLRIPYLCTRMHLSLGLYRRNRFPLLLRKSKLCAPNLILRFCSHKLYNSWEVNVVSAHSVSSPFLTGLLTFSTIWIISTLTSSSSRNASSESGYIFGEPYLTRFWRGFSSEWPDVFWEVTEWSRTLHIWFGSLIRRLIFRDELI